MSIATLQNQLLSALDKDRLYCDQLSGIASQCAKAARGCDSQTAKGTRTSLFVIGGACREIEGKLEQSTGSVEYHDEVTNIIKPALERAIRSLANVSDAQRLSALEALMKKLGEVSRPPSGWP